MGNIKIQRASLEDAEAIAPLATQLGYEMTTARAKERLWSLLFDEDHVIVLAWDGARAVGMAHGFVRTPLVSDTHVELAAMVVDEKRRSKGVGAMLLAAIEEWTHEHGLSIVRVPSNVVRERAHRFYERHGYVRHKVQVLLRREIEGRRRETAAESRGQKRKSGGAEV